MSDVRLMRRWLKMIPNALTLCNSLCGFAAILYTLRVYECPVGKNEISILAGSAVMILCAMIFDSLDGFAARLLDASSLHGVQMDSLSDMVTFGVAPATLVAVMTHRFWQAGRLENWETLIIFVLCSVYLGGAALRLATYNVHAMLEKKSDETFTGLPSPGAAAAVCVLVISANVYGLDNLWKYAFWLPVYAAFLGILMISPIKYQHGGKWLFSAGKHPGRIIAIAVLIALLLIALLSGRAVALLAAAVTLYVVGGVVLAVAKFIGLEE